MPQDEAVELLSPEEPLLAVVVAELLHPAAVSASAVAAKRAEAPRIREA
ncbi:MULTISPECIES: hypothetical protein [Streptacidiphilus]|uniref:Uncharacterized protein n=2 Tax=Streptacidiphilus TaxID=228398 RepID=A0ABV6UHT8_9ACTN|nr:hypothetical protein [Streptacidiphilus jeojiense]